jgi:hypothetical protein
MENQYSKLKERTSMHPDRIDIQTILYWHCLIPGLSTQGHFHLLQAAASNNSTSLLGGFEGISLSRPATPHSFS